MSDKRTPRDALRQYQSGGIVEHLNSGRDPRGFDLPPFAIKRNKMLADEAKQELIYKGENARHIALPPQAPQGPANILEAMRQYGPQHLQAMGRASPRGQMQAADNLSAAIDLAARRHRIENSEMPAEFGSPGLRGALFEAFQNFFLGNKRLG